MQFVDIEKKDGGAYLHRYDLHYIDRTGCPRTYEMVSRDRNIDSLAHLQQHRTDAVVMVLTDAKREHMALNHEFRMELGQRIYGLPGGLIEPGETPEEAARRELGEETGLRLVAITHVLPPAACTVGIGDERTVCLFGIAEGTFRPSSDPMEEIESGWYTRAQVRALHETDLFGSWALAYSWMFANGCLPEVCGRCAMFYTETYCPGVADFDRDGKLAYEAILRILENTASRHSDSSGDDVIDGSRRGITWVLTDWRVEIVRRPQSKAPLQVATWVRDNAPVGRVFRDYTITDTSGTELVRAESRLILFDLRTEKIVRIDRERFASYRPEARSVFPDTAPRLRAPDVFDTQTVLPLRRCDIDFNGHVHNTRYLEFALEALPETMRCDAFRGFRIVYPKAVKDTKAVTLKYTAADDGAFVCLYSADTLCTIVRFEI